MPNLPPVSLILRHAVGRSTGHGLLGAVVFFAALVCINPASAEGTAAPANLVAGAPLDLKATIPVAPDVTTGKLANGLSYYIRKNARPEKRLGLRLVVKAGSVLEDDDQLGLAHVVEHMAFNGSTHFKKHELISFLQSIGVKFGADLNASTGFDETIYQLPIPTDKPENIEQGFLVLQDFAQGVLFNAADVDAERGIVLEELRLGKGASDRMNKVLFPKVFEGSKYANRLPIGTEESLNSFKLAAIKRFYADWYRPDLMAVMVVGDIEPLKAKALIDKYFSVLKNPAKPRARSAIQIPARTTSEALVITDKEATNDVVLVRYPVERMPPNQVWADYRVGLVEALFGVMLGQRMAELTQQADAPFVGGSGSVSRLVGPYRSFNASAVLGRAGLTPAVNALVETAEKARQFGFAADELERAKKLMLRFIEQAFDERDKTNSGRHASEMERNFLVEETMPGIELEHMATRQMMPSITLAEVNAYAKKTIPHDAAKLVVFMGVDKAGATAPTAAQLMASVVDAEGHTVVAQKERALPDSLVSTTPKAGRIVAESQDAVLGLTRLTLSNGVKVVLKATDFKNDEVRLSALRQGGQSLFDNADKFNVAYLGSVIGAMGLLDYTPTEVGKILAGKSASVSVSLNPNSDSVEGSASTKDLEPMFQLLSIRFAAAPRKDPDLFKSFITRSQDVAKNALLRPETVYSDVIRTTLFKGHPRVNLTAQPQDFDRVGLDRSAAIFSERFSSAKGLTFFIVGNFSQDTIRPLIETYMASLPTPDLPLAFRDLGIRPVTGVVKKEVRAGTEAKSNVSITFTGVADYNEQEQLRLALLTEVLNIRLIDELREKLKLIYGGGMGGGISKLPYENYSVGLNLPCAPQNVDLVITAAFAEIQKVKDVGPDPADLDKVKENARLNNRRALRENGHWLGSLQAADFYGQDPANILRFEQRVNAVTVADLKLAARKYLNFENYLQVVLYPQGHPEKK